MFKQLAAASGVLLLGISGVEAQSFVSECAASLKPDTSKLLQNYALRIAYLDNIDQENYEKSKHNANISVLLDGIPVGASYSDFDEARKSFKQRIGYSLANSVDTDLTQTVLSANAVSAFSECVKSVSTEPLVAFVQAANAQTAIIRLVKRDPPGTASIDTLQTVVVGGRIIGDANQSVKYNAEFTMTFARVKGEDLVATFNLADGSARKGSATISIPAYRDIVKATIASPLASAWAEVYCGGYGSADTRESPTISLAPSNPTRRIVLSSLQTTEQNPEQGDHCTAGDVQTKIIKQTEAVVSFRSVCIVRDKNCRAQSRSQIKAQEIEDVYTEK